jgi:anti-sigma-K factor RskA
VPAPDAVRAATLAAIVGTAQVAGTAAGTASGTGAVPGAGPSAGHVPPTRPVDPGTTRTRPPAGPRAATRPSAGPGRVPGRRPGRARLLLTALVAVVAIALPTTVAWQQGRRAAEAEARTDAITALLATPGAQIATGTLTSGGEAVAVVTADAGLVTVTGATDPGADRVYQLWVMRDGQPLAGLTSDVVGGVVQISTDEFRTGDALALTVEPAGGSEQPTSEPVVVLAPA